MRAILILFLCSLSTMGLAQGIERVANTAASGADFARDQLWNTQFGALKAENAILKTQIQSLTGHVVQLQQLLGASATTVVTTTVPAAVVSGTLPSATLVTQTVPALVYPRCAAHEYLTSDGTTHLCQRLALPATPCTATQVLSWDGTRVTCREEKATVTNNTNYAPAPIDCRTLGLIQHGDGCAVPTPMTRDWGN